ncbi:hypothetical protein RIF29_29458 [Crotalaria pallida]|uniref:Sec7/BIG1-like C-terminal domain-containing protein n=1 Tax=Crotalaria pallida TaxID=3830 RepID=A0AAN9EEW3_CROPI
MEQESDNLIDVMGVLTGISTDREYLREGKVIKMVVMELSDTQLSTYSSEVLFRRDWAVVPVCYILDFLLVPLHSFFNSNSLNTLSLPSYFPSFSFTKNHSMGTWLMFLQSMSFMNNKIFRRHLREFYPLLTKLACCDQMDVRGALGDLFQAQLKALLP